MNSDQSVLTTLCTRIRMILDEVDVDGKFKDDVMVRHVLPPSIENVFARLNMDRENPIYLDYSFTTDTTVNYYVLPPNIQEIERIVQLDSQGFITAEIRPRSRLDWRGQGWSIEGNELMFDPLPTSAATWHILYIPAGLMFPHKGTGTLDSGLDTVTLATSPTLGDVDRRIGGYNGQILRIIPASGVVEERIIETHTLDGSDWKVTVRRPFTSTSAGSVTYEIVPSALQGLMESVVYAACLKIATARRLSGAIQSSLQRDLHSAIKTEGDRVSNMNSRGKKFEVNTVESSIGRINPFAIGY